MPSTGVPYAPTFVAAAVFTTTTGIPSLIARAASRTAGPSPNAVTSDGTRVKVAGVLAVPMDDVPTTASNLTPLNGMTPRPPSLVVILTDGWLMAMPLV